MNVTLNYLGITKKLKQILPGLTLNRLDDLNLKTPLKSVNFRPNYYAFLLVKNGAGKVIIDDNTYSIRPQSLIFLNPGNTREFFFEHIDEIFVVTFNDLFLKESIHDKFLQIFPFLFTEVNKPIALEERSFQELFKLLHDMHEEIYNRSIDRAAIIGHQFALFLYFLKRNVWENYSPLWEGKHNSKIVKNFKSLLQQHYRDFRAGNVEKVYSAAAYAEQMELDCNYLEEIILSKTGKSISEWAIDKSVAEAKILLATTQDSFTSIANKLGFEDSVHFIYHFKEKTKKSPIQFRKDHFEGLKP
ncbi:helix-turn-helix domain-containing protein [Sphingobacterium sp. Mn56C]|uniref:helix-turn-helix domain-containing protein n=1 Tax=Sphingobacterium sp. Mn56C TaxID=3395261 RepID=UPI003BD5FDFD